jgi:hypothetical protein
VYNSIIRNNSVDDTVGAITLENSTVGDAVVSPVMDPDTNNIYYPLLIPWETPGLRSSSPYDSTGSLRPVYDALNALPSSPEDIRGIILESLKKDGAGNSRVQGGIIDLGALEN